MTPWWRRLLQDRNARLLAYVLGGTALYSLFGRLVGPLLGIDESYFGPTRTRGHKGRGNPRKVPVFGILERGGRVHCQIVKNCSKTTLQAIIGGRVELSAEITTDGFKSYDGLVEAGFSKHHRINKYYGRDKVRFSENGVHINGIESFWSPVHGPIGFGEKLETAIRREVLDDTGITRPMELIDLQMPSRWLIGDEQIIEWSFGFRAIPDTDDLELDSRWAEFRWADFSTAYPALELDHDRAAIMRLHALLHAA